MAGQFLWPRAWPKAVHLALSAYVFFVCVTGLILPPGSNRYAYSDIGEANLDANADRPDELSARQAAKPMLRILGLGASIMYGYRSSDGNG